MSRIRAAMRAAFSRTAWWPRVARVRDALGRPAHKEVITNLSFAAQHAAGSLLMLAGALLDGPAGDALYRHGVLCEVSFCALDVFNLCARRYPYEAHTRPALVALVLLHHLPAPAYLLANECCVSAETKRIGLSLLGAGTVSIGAAGAQYALDASSCAGRLQQLAMHAANVALFCYCRFRVFPSAFLAAIAKRERGSGRPLLAVGFFVLMSAFNCAGLFLLLDKLVKVGRSVVWPRRFKPE